MSDLFTETLASRFAAMRAELRASPGYLPPCPLCSCIGHDDTPDIIRTPFITKGRRSGLWSVHHKCELIPSGVGPWFDTEVQAARWWRDARLNGKLGASSDARRALNLERLTEKEWEPVDTTK